MLKLLSGMSELGTVLTCAHHQSVEIVPALVPDPEEQALDIERPTL